ncbi:MAG: TlpA family protein disulfide reductase [Solirubrobacteraceae bacterium]|nr:TlpA family protein disulfide reductase [Solirubrobacteraceae bacterium]
MRRSPVPVAVVVLAVLLIAVLGFALAGTGGSNLDSAVQRGERPTVPDGAAALELPVLGTDATQSLDALKGQVVVVNVWGSWCEPCKDEAPLISGIHDALKAAGEGQVLGVTHVDPSEKSLAFQKEFALTFPSVRDVDDDLYNAFGGTGTPETYVLDRDGRVAAIRRGVITAEFANEALEAAGATARVSAELEPTP